MDLQAALAAKRGKLKKTTKTNDVSAPKLSGFMTETEVKDHVESVWACNIEEWNDLIIDLTFPTDYVPLSMDECKLLMSCNRAMKQGGVHGPLSPELDSIMSRLQTTMEQVRLDSKAGVFVKLSCRSAKDALLDSSIRDLFEGYCVEHKAETSNGKLSCLIRAATNVLQVFSAEEAMRMLLRSDRIYEDLELLMQHPDRWENVEVPQNIVVRQWVPIEPDAEFRGFVWNNEMCALSQYNYAAYFPDLAAQGDAMKNRLLAFFDSFKSRLEQKHYSNYIVDFAVTPERIYVIELNPFGPHSDSCLFSYKTEVDTVLKLPPCTYRILTSPHPNVDSVFANNVAQFIREDSKTQ